VTEQFPRKLYGRRKGPKLSAHKEDLRRTLLPRIALRIEPGADPRSYFSPPPRGEVEARSASGGGPAVDDVWLEIGFGAGEHLLALARANPHVGLIGAEPYEAGVAKLLTHMADAPPANIRIHEGDARDIIAALPDASLGRVFILFPDPWPKTRHAKRRFIGPGNLPMMAHILADDAEFRIATDDVGYVRWTLQHLTGHPDFLWLAASPRDWRDPPEGWVETRYQSKAVRSGRRPVFLRFRRRPRGEKSRKSLRFAGRDLY